MFERVGDHRKIWAVIPAAGVGKRMGGSIPKQYLSIQQQSIIELTLNKLLSLSCIEGVVVAISSSDTLWPSIARRYAHRVHTVEGGRERCDSVLNALAYLNNKALVNPSANPQHFEDTWVMVHDAVRPCVHVKNIEALILQTHEQRCGGILAKPVADTLKRVSQGEIETTVDRTALWCAHTPQLFPLAQLHQALEACSEKGLAVTDEASSIEQLGGRVVIVQDRADNIKITHPDDLRLASLILQAE